MCLQRLLTLVQVVTPASLKPCQEPKLLSVPTLVQCISVGQRDDGVVGIRTGVHQCAGVGQSTEGINGQSSRIHKRIGSVFAEGVIDDVNSRSFGIRIRRDLSRLHHEGYTDEEYACHDGDHPLLAHI